MNDISALYKDFNTHLIKPKKDNINPNNKKRNNKSILIPPLITIATGGIVSKIHNTDIFKKAEKSKENFKSGLKQGYKANSLYLQIQDEIKISRIMWYLKLFFV